MHAARGVGELAGFLVSDLLTPEGVPGGLDAVRAHFADVAVVHVVSLAEQNPSLSGEVELVDAESGRTLELGVSLATLVAAYRQRFADWLDAREAECRRRGLRYIRVRTDRPVNRGPSLTSCAARRPRPMTLLAPLALAAVLIPAAIYVIHWLFGARRRHRVSAIFLWADLPQANMVAVDGIFRRSPCCWRCSCWRLCWPSPRWRGRGCLPSLRGTSR